MDLTMSSEIAGMAATTVVTSKLWGMGPEDEPIYLYTLKSSTVEACVTNFGARLVRVKTADRRGKIADIVLGYDSLDGYLADKKTYFGAIVGRYGNRIAAGKFLLDGQSYQLPINDEPNTLHGGPVGFDQKVWSGEEIPGGIELTLTSPDGDMGFPGSLKVKVRYTLSGDTLRVEYSATTDKDTVINLTNHSYFNLRGDDEGDILNHELTLFADRFTPVDVHLIPTGELAEVAGTALDFDRPAIIGSRIGDPHPQLLVAGGYDHNFVVKGKSGEMNVAAHVSEPISGRQMTVATTQPGIQFYAGNFLDGTFIGRHGIAYTKRTGLCLETQHFPDSPNHPMFPTTTLRPGETLHSATTFTFGLA